MLGDADVTTMVAVRDLAEATTFYEKALGLARIGENPGGFRYRSGNSDLIVYRSDSAGTNKASIAAWTVGDVAETVRDLKSNGVSSFQRYDDLPGLTRDGDIHDAGGFKIAWFKDPTGNILEINGR
jgi:catechol 2,3-dioxygenase-like lactoylglutathione lyase family enzyme